jgi:rhodanese-related sulfurtransferase
MTEYGRQEAGEPYRRISVTEALKLQNQGALVVDVRRDDEWETGHPVGAVHIPVDDVLAQAEENLPKGRQLLFICAAGVRSGLACEMVSALGYESALIFNIEDGMPVWMEQSLPTEYGA